jgi:hypothetical protein
MVAMAAGLAAGLALRGRMALRVPILALAVALAAEQGPLKAATAVYPFTKMLPGMVIPPAGAGPVALLITPGKEPAVRVLLAVLF